MKQINKEKSLEKHKIDSDTYNADKVYKIVKNNKLDFEKLNKETLLLIILNDENNLEDMSTINCDIISKKSEKEKKIKSIANTRSFNIKNQSSSFLGKKRKIVEAPKTFNIIINKNILNLDYNKNYKVKNQIIINSEQETQYMDTDNELKSLKENLRQNTYKTNNKIYISEKSSFSFVIDSNTLLY